MFDFDPKKDYYNALWVAETATEDDIKKAFRKLALQYHPDRGGDQEKFKEINEAFQVVGDPKKRQQYDQVRKWGFGWFGGDGFWGFWGGGATFDFGGFDVGDLFGDLLGGMGGGQSARRPRRGQDVQVNLQITFEEAYAWVEKSFTFKRSVLAKDLESKQCSECNGSWVTMQATRTPFGVMQMQTACATCGGVGAVFTKKGKEVKAVLEKEDTTISVDVPAWIEEGTMFKYVNKGHEAATGGNPWDLYVNIVVKPTEKYARKWDDIILKPEISIFDCVLWGEIEVPHPEWPLTVKIPKGTQVGDVIKVPNKGFGKSGVFAKKGNVLIIPKVLIPKKLSKTQEKLRTQLKQEA